MIHHPTTIESSNRTLRRLAGVLMVLLLALYPALPAWAQPLHPQVSLTRPYPGTANRLDVLRTVEPRIAILESGYTTERVPGAGHTVRDAVYQWEMLLLGLNLPYRLLSDRDLTRGVSSEFRVLILPAAEALSERQRRSVLQFTERGGGLIASGRTGVFDERGQPGGEPFFRQLFGADLVTNLPAQSAGILQALDGGHPVTTGLPAGYRLNLSPQTPTTAARAVSSAPSGRAHSYTPPEPGRDPFADVSLIVYGRYGSGNTLWMRFNPQDVSRDSQQQAVYQALAVNTLAYCARVPAVGIRAWPNGQQSATVLAGLPLIGTDANYLASTNRALDVLESAGSRATFFLTSREAALFPDLIRRMDRAAEIAISADTDEVLKKKARDAQRRRLESARNELRRFTDQPVLGLHPPGGFYDVSTVQAMRDAGLRYMMLSSVQDRAVPHTLDWHRDADYREPLLADAGATATGQAGGRPSPTDRIIALPATGRDDYTVLSVMKRAGDPSAQLAAYREDFISIHRGHGLYVLPFHAELQALTRERAEVLGQVATLARGQGSWVASFREVYEWWAQRDQLGITISTASDNSLTLEVTNGRNQSVSGASLEVWLGQPARTVTADAGASVRIADDGRSATVTVPTLRSGTNRITLTFDRR